jgi:hypothetical protein
MLTCLCQIGNIITKITAVFGRSGMVRPLAFVALSMSAPKPALDSRNNVWYRVWLLYSNCTRMANLLTDECILCLTTV